MASSWCFGQHKFTKPGAKGHYWAQLLCWVVLGGVLALYGQALTHQMGMPVPISPSTRGTYLLQAQKKPATLCGFLVETTIFMKSNLSRIRIAACALAGERTDVFRLRGALKPQAWMERQVSGLG